VADATVLTGWENFYVIVGSSAGALIGLQFVVMTLLADRPNRPGLALAGSAFATPTIVHFGTVLLLSALTSAPWQTVSVLATLWLLLGVTGIIYVAVVAWRMRVQTVYKPVFEDWLFHALLPFAAYATITGSACTAYAYAHGAMFGMGVAALLLLFIGIHNAWDAVTFHVYSRKRPKDETAQ
jgi:nucleoside recognition membrane protein YjiH